MSKYESIVFQRLMSNLVIFAVLDTNIGQRVKTVPLEPFAYFMFGHMIYTGVIMNASEETKKDIKRYNLNYVVPIVFQLLMNIPYVDNTRLLVEIGEIIATITLTDILQAKKILIS